MEAGLTGLRVSGLGFWVQAYGFRVEGSERAQGLGFGFRVQTWLGAWGLDSRVFRVLPFGFNFFCNLEPQARIPDLGFRVNAYTVRYRCAMTRIEIYICYIYTPPDASQRGGLHTNLLLSPVTNRVHMCIYIYICV